MIFAYEGAFFLQAILELNLYNVDVKIFEHI